MTTLDPRPAARVDPLEAVLRPGLLRAVLQPVHDVATGRPVAVEALLRGPADSSLASPAHLFRAAAAAGRTGELDRAAVDTALAAAAGAPRTLFLNSSLEGFTTPPDVPAGLEVVVDVPARALLRAPGAAVRLLRRVRALGLRVALDDVGAEADVAALLPVVRPEVVKLDLRLLARRPAEEVAALVGAVGAHAARTGALVLVESVEDEEDRRSALALGADLVAGWGVAHPARPQDLPAPAGPLPLPPPPAGAPAGRWGSAPTRTVPADVAEAALAHLRLRARHQDPVALVSLGGPAARRAAADLGRVAVRAHGDLEGHGLAVLGADTACVVLVRPGAAPAERELLVSHDRALVADLVADVLATERAPVREAAAAPAPRPPALADVVGRALEADRATGTGTGLLLVGVDGTCRRGGREAVVRRMRRAVRSVDRWIPLGPDLFAVLLTGLPRAGSEGVVERVADALLLAVELAVDDHPAMSVSIGASLAPARAATAAEAHRQAAAALESARGAGGACARIWPV